MKKIIYTTVFFSLFIFVFAQTGTDTKAKQLEEMRKLKQQMMEDQKTIQQQNEWNNQSSQTEIKQRYQQNTYQFALYFWHLPYHGACN